MLRTRRTIGSLVGGIGVAVSVVLLVVVWIIDSRTVGAIDRAFDAVDGVVVEVEASLVAIGDRLDEIVASDEPEVVDRAAAEVEDRLERLEGVVTALIPALEVADQLLPTSIDRSAADALVTAADGLASLRESLESALVEGTTSLQNTAAELAAGIEERIDRVDVRVDDLQSTLDDARSSSRRFVHLIAAGLSILIVWFGAGQVALFTMSRRAGRAPSGD